MTSTKTTRQIETDKRKQLILETAVDAFIELGYQQTGIREIARRAQVSLGNLYNHFPSKEAVLIELAELEALELEQFHDILSEDASPQSRLAKFIDSYLPYVARPECTLLAIEILSEAVRNPNIAEVFDGSRNRLIGALDSCLQELKQPDQIVKTTTARLILELTEAHARHIVFSGGRCSRKDKSIVCTMVGSGIGASLNSKQSKAP